EVVVMVDADCRVSPGTIQQIALAAHTNSHPVQAVYRMEQPPEPSLRDRLSAFAFIVKNRVRAGGLSQLGVPIMLGGTGMAFPWQALQSVELASGHIVEDMKLGIDLAIAGYIPTLSLESEVVGILPDDEAAATSQRTRWEHGHLQVLTTYVPKLLGQALRQRRLDLLTLAVDLAIPPLALWSLLGLALTTVTGVAALLGVTSLPFHIQLFAGCALVSAILFAWLVWGRQELSFSQLLAIPSYILWKIPMYLKVLIDPQKSWVRTKRNG
ncbi:MAG: glycosyltransferase, partial [Cyanobacteria bacterium J06626_18]